MSISNRSEGPIRVNDPQTPVVYSHTGFSLAVFDAPIMIPITTGFLEQIFDGTNGAVMATISPVDGIFRNARIFLIGQNAFTIGMTITLFINNQSTDLVITIPPAKLGAITSTGIAIVKRGDEVIWITQKLDIGPAAAQRFNMITVELHPTKIG